MRRFHGTFFKVAVACTVLMVVAPQEPVSAEVHCQRTRTRCGIPKHRYGHDTPRPHDIVLAIADQARDVTWLKPEARIAGGVKQSATVEETVQRKPFHFPANSLTVRHIKLDQVGLALYSTGDIFAGGRLTHDGGPDGDLSGNHVTIRLRAYAGLPGRRGEPVDWPVVWQAQQEFWISRQRPQAVSLVPVGDAHSPHLRLHFHEITHLAVELEFRLDR